MEICKCLLMKMLFKVFGIDNQTMNFDKSLPYECFDGSTTHCTCIKFCPQIV